MEKHPRPERVAKGRPERAAQAPTTADPLDAPAAAGRRVESDDCMSTKTLGELDQNEDDEDSFRWAPRRGAIGERCVWRRSEAGGRAARRLLARAARGRALRSRPAAKSGGGAGTGA